jgi:thioredoxin 1
MNVNKGNINSVLNTNKVVVLFFSNPTCGPCEGVKISLGVVEKSYPGVVYAYVNTHADEEVPRRYGVRTTPTLVFIKQNREIGRLTGSASSAKIVSIIKPHV